MDRITASYWGIVAVLFAAATFFGVNAEIQRRDLQKAAAKVETGALVHVVTIVDGSTVVVANDQGERTTIAILGLRSIAGRAQRDPLAVWGEAAESALKRLTEGKAVRVLLHNPSKDKQGRTLASLFLDDQDIGMQLVTEGLGLVFPVYPFAALPLYLREQDGARSARRGFWSHPDAIERAAALALQWQQIKP